MFVELFFNKIRFEIKFALYFVVSLIVSTYLVYFVAFIFGLGRLTVLLTLSPFLLFSVPLLIKRKSDFSEYFKSNKKGIFTALFMAVVYFIALYPAILGREDNYLVMSSVNWQDTALHMSITQNLTQGNFPPQAPYFSGQPLSYYYFSDLHSAIINLFYGEFFPRIFVLDNAFLAGVFTLTVYAFSSEVTKNKNLSAVSAFMATLFGSLIFTKFISSVLKGDKVLDLLRNNTYSMEYMQIFGMANMADYYLQNRPMMIGFLGVVMITVLSIYTHREKNIPTAFLSGIVTACLIQFQFFSVVACGLSFLFLVVIGTIKKDAKFAIKSLVAFSLPVLILYLILGVRTVNEASFLELLKRTFHFSPWSNIDRSSMWYFGFVMLNLGLPFIISLTSIFQKRQIRSLKNLTLLSLVFVLIPCIMTFTIAKEDMIKFFYFPAIISCVVSPIILKNVIKQEKMFLIAISILIFTTTFSSVLTLTNSFLNKNFGYSFAEYDAGLWIRKFTPFKSVFVTMPTIHSAPADFGGRLRIISYINWPYTHGFNIGKDNVFTRAQDVEEVYKTGDIEKIKLKYSPDYIYFGQEERQSYPTAGSYFDKHKNLIKVYSKDNIDIYRILN